jgi:hypothetical protein
MALVMHYDWSHALQVLYPGAIWQVELTKDDKQILHWMDDNIPRPNEADLEAWCIEKSKEEPMRLLRRERDKELDMCNWRVVKAFSMGEELPQDWKDYMQALRDLPQKTNWEDIRMDDSDYKRIDRSSVDWPKTPSDWHYPITLKGLYQEPELFEF